jgi:hypothetical protein
MDPATFLDIARRGLSPAFGGTFRPDGDKEATE